MKPGNRPWRRRRPTLSFIRKRNDLALQKEKWLSNEVQVNFAGIRWGVTAITARI
jgi:hypothetical protein